MKKMLAGVAIFAVILSSSAYAEDDSNNNSENGNENGGGNGGIFVTMNTNPSINANPTAIANANPTINANPTATANANPTIIVNPFTSAYSSNNNFNQGGQGGQGGTGYSSSYVNSNPQAYGGSSYVNSNPIANGGNSFSNSNSNSDSQAYGGNSYSSSDPQAYGGSSSSSLNSSPQSAASVGDVSVTVQNPTPPPPAASVPNAQALNPVLSDPSGQGANAQGLDLALKFFEECGLTFEDGVDLSEMREKGASRMTNVVFTPHSNYAKYGDSRSVKTAAMVDVKNLLKRNNHRFACIGLLQVEAIGDEDASKVGIATIFTDAGKFMKGRLSGHRRLYAISINDAISLNNGVVSQGSGLGIAPGLSNMFGQVLGTLGGSATSSDGAAFKATQFGNTFIVVTDEYPTDAVSIDVAVFQSK